MYIKVKVKTESKNEKVIKKSKDTFEIFVREKAERGLANKRGIELLRDYLKVYNSDIRIVKGHQSQSKIINIEEKI